MIMKKINIKFLSDDALNFMKQNVDLVTDKIKSEENNKWIYEEFPQPMFIDKNFFINDFQLLENEDSKNKETDFFNSIKIYEYLKLLPKYILCDERFWLWLHFEKFFKEVKSFVKIQGVSTIENAWLHKQGVRRGLMFGVLSRMFFRVYLTVDDSNDKTNRFNLTKRVIDNPYRYRELSWRTYSSNKKIVRGILIGEKKAIDENPQLENNEFYNTLAKKISLLGSVKYLDVISEEDISNYIYDNLLKLMNSTTRK